MQTCANCGYETATASRFCARCGSALGDATQAPPPAGSPPPPSFTPPPTPNPWGTPHTTAPPEPPPPQPLPYGAPHPPPNPYAPPAAGAPYFPAGYAGYPYRTTNGFAIASLILGLVGWITCGVGSVLAIIFGFISNGQIKASQGRQGGSGMAIAGIILGFVGIGLIVLLVVAGRAGTSNG